MPEQTNHSIIAAGLRGIMRRLKKVASGSYFRREFVLGDWRALPAERAPGRPRVAWVLAGNQWLGSARLKGFLMDQLAHTTDTGFDSVIAYYWEKNAEKILNLTPTWRRRHWLPFLQRTDVVVVEAWLGNTEELLADCARNGVASILILSDLIYEQIPKSVLSLANAIVVSSEHLRQQGAPYHSHIVCIDDALDMPPHLHREQTARGNRPEVVWVGNVGNWYQVEFMREVLAAADLRDLPFRTISLHPEATVQWDPLNVWKQLASSDVGVVPCKLSDWGKSKSSNRVAMLLALGYPVIATPLPAYEEFISHGVNGYFATTIEEWRERIRELRSPERRALFGAAAVQTPALQNVQPEHIAGEWNKLFRSICSP